MTSHKLYIQWSVLAPCLVWALISDLSLAYRLKFTRSAPGPCSLLASSRELSSARGKVYTVCSSYMLLGWHLPETVLYVYATTVAFFRVCSMLADKCAWCSTGTVGLLCCRSGISMGIAWLS